MQSIKEKFLNLNKEVCHYEIVSRKGYGYEVDDPIRIKSVFGEYSLINVLAPENKSETAFCLKEINRLETTFSEKLNSTIDHLELLFLELENEIRVYKIYDLYFCAYKENNQTYSKVEQILCSMGEFLNDVKLPEGFRFKARP